mgnify:FL=1
MRTHLGVLLLLLAVVVTAVFFIAVFAWQGEPRGSQASSDVMPQTLGGRPQGHVYTSAVEEPADVNPLTAQGAVAQSLVLGVTHDSLLDRDARTGALRNALAASHEVAADGLSCIFELRDGLVFSDGTPVTMRDVMFAWELAKAGHLPLGFVGAAFARVRAVDVVAERRLRVHFRKRYFANVAAVGEGWLVASRTFFEDRVARRLVSDEAMPAIESPRFAQLLDQVNLESGPGTGPYELHNDDRGASNWRRRQSLVLVRNESSWRRQVRPGTWNFRAMRLLFRDQAGARNALLRGEVDWYSGSDLDALLAAHESLAEQCDKHVYDYPQLGVYRVVWNCRRAPFDDVRVRQALSMLVPRQDIVAMLGGGAQAAVAHAKPGSPSYPVEAAAEFDPVAARQLLRIAGFDPEKGKPLRMTLLALQGSESLRRITELLRNSLHAAGVVLDVRPRELTGFVTEQKRGEWHGALVLQWFDASGDPYRFLHSEGRSNPGGWQHEQADALASAARLELDAVARDRLWRRLHLLAHREQPVALLAHPAATVLLRKYLRDYQPGAYGLRPEWAWVPAEHQRR